MCVWFRVHACVRACVHACDHPQALAGQVRVRVTQGLSLSNSAGVIETNGLSFSILMGVMSGAFQVLQQAILPATILWTRRGHESKIKKETEKQTKKKTKTTMTATTTKMTKTTTQWVMLLQIRHPWKKKKKDKTTAPRHHHRTRGKRDLPVKKWGNNMVLEDVRPCDRSGTRGWCASTTGARSDRGRATFFPFFKILLLCYVIIRAVNRLKKINWLIAHFEIH